MIFVDIENTEGIQILKNSMIYMQEELSCLEKIKQLCKYAFSNSHLCFCGFFLIYDPVTFWLHFYRDSLNHLEIFFLCFWKTLQSNDNEQTNSVYYL